MKKLFVLTFIFSLITLTAQSQTFTVPVSVTSSTYPQLLVNSSSTSSSTGIRLTNASNYQYEVANHTTNYFYVFDRTAQQYRFAINSSGNVGIGTVSPTYKLHVNSTTNGWASMVENQGCIVYSAYGNGAADGYGMHIKVNNTRNDRYALQIYDGTNNLLYVRNDGNTGFGTSTPSKRVSIVGTTAITSSLEITRFNGAGSGYPSYLNLRSSKGSETTPLVVSQNDKLGQLVFWGYKDAGVRAAEWVPGASLGSVVENNSASEHLVKSALVFYTNEIGDYSVDPTEKMRITSNGNVGIGTANPDFKLTVNGNIKAEYVNIVSEVVSDYVFEKDYKLLSLKDLENFVKTEKHLPDVPSAAEFQKNGYSVGQMDDLLLRKVEELTLYIIEQQKLFEAQQKLIEQLQEKVEQLEK